MKPKRLWTILVGELLLAFLCLLLGHGRLEMQLAIFTGFQLLFPFFALFIILLRRFKSWCVEGSQLTKAGKITVTVWTILMILVIVGWITTVFPALVDASLQHFGKHDTATIVSYRLIHYSSRNTEYIESDLSRADALTVTLNYQGHTPTIAIDKTDKGFSQVYQDAQSSTPLPIRYLPWLPVISRPEAEL